MVERVPQDPNAHLPWAFDWNAWLTARGFTVGDVLGVSWTVPAPLTKTHEDFTAGIATVWIKDVPAGQRVNATCTIRLPPPAVGQPEVTDDRTIVVTGINR